MEKKKSAMKKFFGEFKTFITRGNVLDMAVGVIVGSAFTAIVNALSDHILRPVINLLLPSFSARTRSATYTPSSCAGTTKTGSCPWKIPST